jgi:hypothetical protein
MKYTKSGSGLPRFRTLASVQGNPAPTQGIEGVVMGKVYYKRMRKAAHTVSCIALLLLPNTSVPQEQPKSVPMRTSALDSHEGMTIGAEPLTSSEQYKSSFPKKNPYASGILAIRVMFRNETGDSIRVNISRIRLSLQIAEDNRQELASLTSEDVADVVFTSKVKDPSKRVRLPVPLPSSTKIGRGKDWTELVKQAEEAGFRAGVIAPHSTAEGLLYFDLQGQYDLLTNARLYVPELVALEKNHGLLFFDIDLSRATPR